jgi:hypothetical protein
MYQIPCQNCKGNGILPHYKHVENGICFECSGSGIQQVNELEYNEYKQEIERKKRGKYILFNKGSIEYYKTEKEIIKKYGNFFSDSYGLWAVKSCYKDRNIVYTNYTKNSSEFINNCNQFYHEYLERSDREFKELVRVKINKLYKELGTENDIEYIEMIKNRINKLESSL